MPKYLGSTWQLATMRPFRRARGSRTRFCESGPSVTNRGCRCCLHVEGPQTPAWQTLGVGQGEALARLASKVTVEAAGGRLSRSSCSAEGGSTNSPPLSARAEFASEAKVSRLACASESSSRVSFPAKEREPKRSSS